MAPDPDPKDIQNARQSSLGLHLLNQQAAGKKRTAKAASATSDTTLLKKKKSELTWCQKYTAKQTGRTCDHCGQADSSPDPVDPKVTRVWARHCCEDQILVILKTEGSTCWYCFRVWSVCYSQKWTLTVFKKELKKAGQEEGTLRDEQCLDHQQSNLPFGEDRQSGEHATFLVAKRDTNYDHRDRADQVVFAQGQASRRAHLHPEVWEGGHSFW